MRTLLRIVISKAAINELKMVQLAALKNCNALGETATARTESSKGDRYSQEVMVTTNGKVTAAV